MLACGFETSKLKLSRDVFGRKIPAALAGAPAFEQVMREKAHIGSDMLRVDLVHGREYCRGQVDSLDICGPPARTGNRQRQSNHHAKKNAGYQSRLSHSQTPIDAGYKTPILREQAAN
jgi:hypothetical protein